MFLQEGVSISAIKSSVHARSRKDSFIDDSEGLEAEDDDDDEEEEEEEEMEFEEERSAKSKVCLFGYCCSTRAKSSLVPRLPRS